MKQVSTWRLMGIISGIVVLFGLVAFVLMQPETSVLHAQVDEELGLEISKTLDGSEVVQVGQVLAFTIRIRNTGTLSITHLVIEDVFDDSIVEPSQVGTFAESGDPPPSIPPGTVSGNTITWDNVVENLPDQELGPGEEITLKVHLRAIHPSESLLTVNYAAIKEAIARGGRKESDVGNDSYNDDVGGNNAPVTKNLITPDPISAGMLVTYTIQVSNDGLVALDSIPLKDRYNPSVLAFVRAVPPPSSSDTANGELTWSDLLAITGRSQLEPGKTIEVITVFKALQAVDGSLNEAEVNGASDRYGNTLAPREAQAPIRIIPAATDTATPTRTPTQVVATPTLTVTTRPVSTPTVSTTIVPHPTMSSTLVTIQPTAMPSEIVVHFTPSPTTKPVQSKPSSNDDDDDDDSDDSDKETPIATVAPTSTDIPVVAETTAPTEVPTATPEIPVLATITPQITTTPEIPIPSTLPNTSGPVSWWQIVVCVILGMMLIVTVIVRRSR